MADGYLDRINKRNLHEWWALLLGIAAGGVFFASIDGLVKEIASSNFRFPAYLILLLLWVLYWEHNRSCSRKTKKNMVGIVVSIYAENDHEEQRLKADFITRLNDRIVSEGLSSVIDVNVLKNHIAAKVQDSAEIQKLNKKINARFYLYGRIRRRLNPGNTYTYFLELSSTVFHVPIDSRNRELLKRDMDAVLPRKIEFLEAIEFQGFQYSADAIYIAVRYIAGIAAFLSLDPVLAQTLHTKLEDELGKMGALPPNLEQVRRRIPMIISDEALSIAQAKFNTGDFTGTKHWLGEAFKKNPTNYPAMLLQSIVDFQVDNDPLKSLARMKKSIKHRNGDGTVFYNLAFLQLWTGLYPDALKSCQKIISLRKKDDDAVRQAVEFNEGLLKEERFKDQLYFWLGFLKYKKENNLPRGLQYLDEFLTKATQDMAVLAEQANTYVSEIKIQMDIN